MRQMYRSCPFLPYPSRQSRPAKVLATPHRQENPLVGVACRAGMFYARRMERLPLSILLPSLILRTLKPSIYQVDQIKTTSLDSCLVLLNRSPRLRRTTLSMPERSIHGRKATTRRITLIQALQSLADERPKAKGVPSISVWASPGHLRVYVKRFSCQD